jgi:major vault protein
MDVIGVSCKAMSSRIRGIISSKSFDDFHKNSHHIIRNAVLKFDAENKIIPYLFEENNFYITDVNSSGYTPVDKGT